LPVIEWGRRYDQASSEGRAPDAPPSPAAATVAGLAPSTKAFRPPPGGSIPDDNYLDTRRDALVLPSQGCIGRDADGGHRYPKLKYPGQPPDYARGEQV